MGRLERPTSCSQSTHSNQLNYIPLREHIRHLTDSCASPSPFYLMIITRQISSPLVSDGEPNLAEVSGFLGVPRHNPQRIVLLTASFYTECKCHHYAGLTRPSLRRGPRLAILTWTRVSSPIPFLDAPEKGRSTKRILILG